MAYHITLNRKAIKQLEKIPVSDYEAIKKAIYGLVNDPKPYGSKKLRGRMGHRIRQGNYRIIYEIDEQLLSIEVIAIGHRKDIYLSRA